MDNGPIAVSSDGTSLSTATGKNVTFNTKYPFAKLDSTKKDSFQIIQVFLSKDTPNPAAGSSNSTQIYSYPHGYTYTPATWFLISLDNFATTQGQEGSWIINFPNPGVSTAYFDVTVDATNVNFYIRKVKPLFASDVSTIGITIYVRAYIFVEDLTGTDVPLTI